MQRHGASHTRKLFRHDQRGPVGFEGRSKFLAFRSFYSRRRSGATPQAVLGSGGREAAALLAILTCGRLRSPFRTFGAFGQKFLRRSARSQKASFRLCAFGLRFRLLHTKAKKTQRKKKTKRRLSQEIPSPLTNPLLEEAGELRLSPGAGAPCL